MKKIAIITLLAGVTTFSLFAFMAFLITSEQVNIMVPPDDVTITVMTLPDEQPAQVKPRPNLQPPTTPPVPQRIIESPEVTEVKTALTYSPPTIINTGGAAKGISLNRKSDGDARPLVRVNPKYPIGAARDGIEGWVVLAFDINTIGQVVNISVVDSQPKRVFDKAAKQALKKWQYKAKSVDRKAVAQHNFTVQLDFKMSQPS